MSVGVGGGACRSEPSIAAASRGSVSARPVQSSDGRRTAGDVATIQKCTLLCYPALFFIPLSMVMAGGVCAGTAAVVTGCHGDDRRRDARGLSWRSADVTASGCFTTPPRRQSMLQPPRRAERPHTHHMQRGTAAQRSCTRTQGQGQAHSSSVTVR